MKTERNSILFTKTEDIDGCVCNTNIYESNVRNEFGKDYFDMTTKEKKEVEKYFCVSITL